MTPLNLAIFPIYMRLWNEEGREATQRFLSKALSWFIVAALFLTGASVLCSREALIVLASMRFVDAERLLSILIPALMIYALHIFFNVGLILERRTALLATIAIAAAAINIIANLYWVPRFALTGAALATLLSYAAMVICLIFVNKTILPLTVNIRLVLSAAIATVLAYPLPALFHATLPLVTLLVRAIGCSFIFLISMAVISSDFREAAVFGWNAARRKLSATRTSASIAPLDNSKTSAADQGVLL
jgi:O-antigen/teichoic acid export membrane protein